MWVMSSMRGNLKATDKRAKYAARHFPLRVNNIFCGFALKPRQTEYDYCKWMLVPPYSLLLTSPTVPLSCRRACCLFRPESSSWSYWIKLLLSLYQAWKHLSPKVCEILEELRAVQVCVSVWASTGVCCLQLKPQPVTYSGSRLQGKQINRKTASSKLAVCWGRTAGSASSAHHRAVYLQTLHEEKMFF